MKQVLDIRRKRLTLWREHWKCVGCLMTYAMSDLHGCYEEYRKMLDQIRFSERDRLYIIGDVVDRGPHPIRLLKDIHKRKNVILLKGNHEVMLSEQVSAFTQYEEGKKGAFWGRKRLARFWHGGPAGTTAREWLKLGKQEQKELLDYVDGLPLYQETTVNGRSFLMVHGGFMDYYEGKPLEDYDEESLVWMRVELDDHFYPGKVIVSGHTPTLLYGKQYEGRIVDTGDKLLIDCGCVFGFCLGCICFDTGEVFYVESSCPQIF